MGKYDDIINLPHHQSLTRPHMSSRDRAAQFAPFAALTGFDDEIEETARLTDKKAVLDEVMKAEIERRLEIISDNLALAPTVALTFFRADEKKSGGAYVSLEGKIKSIAEISRTVIMSSGTKIPIDDIFSVESEILRFFDEP